MTLYRQRREIRWTNTELFLLRGFQQVIASVGIEAAIGSRGWFSQALGHNNLQVYALGQVALEYQGARLNWLLPADFAEKDPLPELLDNLAMEAGLHGAKFITAAAQMDDCLFETLRRGGYCLYGWQSIWQIFRDIQSKDPTLPATWSKPSLVDAPAITSLQRKLLAPATQSVTTFALEALPDYVLNQNSGINGYAYVKRFANKVMITPYILKTVENPGGYLTDLVDAVSQPGDEVYLRQASDSGLPTAELEKIAIPKTSREELLVKHFVSRQAIPAAERNHNRASQRADTTASMLPSTNRKDNI